MDNQAQDQNKDQNNESGKVEKQFNKNIESLTAILGGDESLFKTKLPKDKVGEVVQELISEEEEETKKVIKSDIKELVKSVIAYRKFRKQKQQEMAKADEEQMKEFNKKAEALKSKIEGMHELEKEYRDTLSNENTETTDTPQN